MRSEGQGQQREEPDRRVPRVEYSRARGVDQDNADETRISDTLSGGETFLTSLALSLELSDQVQRAVGAVNLDSLFIDEGFGTLDPDTLALVAGPSRVCGWVAA